jgi:hypothetical protein
METVVSGEVVPAFRATSLHIKDFGGAFVERRSKTGSA